MGKIVTQAITTDLDTLKKTIIMMTKCHQLRSLDIAVLADAMKMLPFSTGLFYDKIYGRWIYTSQDESDWPSGDNCHGICGPDFTFVEDSPEMAIIKGVHYYYHTKIKK